MQGTNMLEYRHTMTSFWSYPAGSQTDLPGIILSSCGSSPVWETWMSCPDYFQVPMISLETSHHKILQEIEE
jgi:hypothetical protein